MPSLKATRDSNWLNCLAGRSSVICPGLQLHFGHSSFFIMNDHRHRHGNVESSRQGHVKLFGHSPAQGLWTLHPQDVTISLPEKYALSLEKQTGKSTCFSIPYIKTGVQSLSDLSLSRDDRRQPQEVDGKSSCVDSSRESLPCLMHQDATTRAPGIVNLSLRNFSLAFSPGCTPRSPLRNISRRCLHCALKHADLEQ